VNPKQPSTCPLQRQHAACDPHVTLPQTAPPQKPNELHVPSEQVPHDPPHPSSPHVLFVQLGVQVPV